MLLQETILCATAPTPSVAGPGLIAIHDIQTGATLASFKQTNAGPHSVAVLQSKNTQGGYILASQPEKSILNVYNFQKVRPLFLLLDTTDSPNQDQMSLKIVLPEKLTAIAIDPRGDLCAGGTAAGRIYLWEVCISLISHRTFVKVVHNHRPRLVSYTIHGTHIIAK